tara:strand:+ start:29 stop:394 length:366 start_codon:yes stop_codon:yes gene_type:complete
MAAKKATTKAKKATTKAKKDLKADVNKDGKVDEKDVKIVKEAAKKAKATPKKTTPQGWSKAQKETFTRFALSGMRSQTMLVQKAAEILGEITIDSNNSKQIAFKSSKHNDRLPEIGYFSVI